MINVLGLNQEDKDVINQSFAQLGQKYKCELDNDRIDDFTNRVSHTGLIRTYTTVAIKNIFKIPLETGPIYILSIYLANFTERLAPRVLIYGLSFQSKSIDDMKIRPVLGFDKFASLFGTKSYDIEGYPAFRKKYMFETKNEVVSNQQITGAFLREVLKQDQINVEFYNKMMITTFNRRINTEDTMALASFMETVKGMGY